MRVRACSCVFVSFCVQRCVLNHRFACLQMQEMEFGASGQLTYRIDVATGSDFGAGTDANLFCTLSGDSHRSSGEFQLSNSLSYANKFERAQASTWGRVQHQSPPRLHAAAGGCVRVAGPISRGNPRGDHTNRRQRVGG